MLRQSRFDQAGGCLLLSVSEPQSGKRGRQLLLLADIRHRVGL